MHALPCERSNSHHIYPLEGLTHNHTSILILRSAETCLSEMSQILTGSLHCPTFHYNPLWEELHSEKNISFHSHPNVPLPRASQLYLSLDQIDRETNTILIIFASLAFVLVRGTGGWVKQYRGGVWVRRRRAQNAYNVWFRALCIDLWSVLTISKGLISIIMQAQTYHVLHAVEAPQNSRDHLENTFSWMSIWVC